MKILSAEAERCHLQGFSAIEGVWKLFYTMHCISEIFSKFDWEYWFQSFLKASVDT